MKADGRTDSLSERMFVGVVPAIQILVSASSFTRAEMFGPLANRLQSRSH